MRTKYNEEDVLLAIKNYNRKEGLPPSFREICKTTGIKSTSTIWWLVRKLEAKGEIQIKAGLARGIILKKSNI